MATYCLGDSSTSKCSLFITRFRFITNPTHQHTGNEVWVLKTRQKWKRGKRIKPRFKKNVEETFFYSFSHLLTKSTHELPLSHQCTDGMAMYDQYNLSTQERNSCTTDSCWVLNFAAVGWLPEGCWVVYWPSVSYRKPRNTPKLYR